MKKLPLIFLGIGVFLSLGYVGFLELYYYRDQVAWLSPLPSAKDLRIRKDPLGSGEFGARRNGGRRHRGVDLLGEEGDPVVASRSGRVRVGEIPDGMGKFVVLTHRGHFKTIYGHLSQILVKDRSLVRQGQVIGSVGKTGNASSEVVKPHLHFEIRQGKKAFSPIPFLTKIEP